MNGRLAALAVLLDLDATPQRLEKILQAQLDRYPEAEPREKAFTANLVYGVLRNRLFLDHVISPYLKKGLESLDPPVLGLLRLGAYELSVLSKKPYAVVNAMVDAAKKSRAKKAQGLINAVLRKVSTKPKGPKLPGLEQDPAQHLSLRYSHPLWLVEEMLSGRDASFVEAWCRADQSEPPASLRVNPLKTSVEELKTLLAPHADSIGPHALCAESLVLEGVKGAASALPGFAEGRWQMQDPAAAAVSLLLGVEPGMRVLDMCAGAGGKTGHLAALMQNRGELVATEPSPGRFAALKKNLARLGVRNAQCLQADASKPSRELGKFDRILIDAPCSALGVMRRRPDVRWRRTPDDPARLAGLQYALARAAAGMLKPGGALVYCTCSITRAENQGVVDKLLAENGGLEPQWPRNLAPALHDCLGPDGFFRTFPHINDTDAFTAVRLRRAD